MRGRMNDGKSYVPPFELGKALDGGAVGEVIESRAKEFKPGDTVTSNFGCGNTSLLHRKNCIQSVARFSLSPFISAPSA